VYKIHPTAYLGGVPSFTERYHESTKYRPETIDRLGGVQWAEQPEPFKDAPPGRKIDLIPHLKPLFEDAETPPDPADPWLRGEALPALARLLYFTLGLTARLAGGGGRDMFLRAAPSAGGLYPTEIYVAVRNFSDLPDGIYHYHSLRSALIPVWEGDFFADLKHHFLGHPAAAEADCLVLFTGMYGRSAWRYKERAYRRILLDTGHAVGNLLEICRATGQDYALLGGFLDEGLEELLFLGPKEEFPLLGVAVGPRGSLPAPIGQYPGEPPAEAIRHAQTGDPMQVQQNACERIRPGFADLLADPAWLPDAFAQPNPESGMGGGIGQWLLFRAADRSLCLFSLVVPPGSRTPVHDHLAWGLVGLYRGTQDEEIYLRGADGALELKERRALATGDFYVLIPPRDDIHRVRTTSPETSVSIHLLTNDTGCVWRHAYDVESGAEHAFRSGYVNMDCEEEET